MTARTAPGMRARKRAETRSRIEAAAVALVLRDGHDATTVEAISQLADVSPRSFFNYFDSKDSAILGVHPRDQEDELIEEHLSAHAGDDLLTSVVRLLLAVAGASTNLASSLHRDRLEIIQRHPEVLSGQLTQLSVRAGRLAETVENLVAVAPGWSQSAPSERVAQAAVLLAMASGAIRAAVRDWVEQTPQGATSPAAYLEDRAVTLIKEVAGNLR